jgi:hypothetical protein
MDKRQYIRTELEELEADQLRSWQGKLSRPSLSPARLQAIAEAARETAASEPRLRRLGSRPAPAWRWAAAAAIALAIGLAIWLLPSTPTDSHLPVLALEELSESEILAYLEANIDEFEWELLEDALTEEEATTLSPLNVLPDTAIESYLETADDWLEDIEYY